MAKNNPGNVVQEFTVPGRNIYDLSHRRSGNCNMGEIIPAGYFTMVPNSRLEVSPSLIMRTMGTENPLLTQGRVRLYAFWVPDRLYVPNYLRDAKIDETEFPVIGRSPVSISPSYNNTILSLLGFYNVRRNSLLQHVGFPAGFNNYAVFGPDAPASVAKYNAMRVLGYFDIFRNYFANRNESDFRFEVAEPLTSGNTFSIATVNDFASFLDSEAGVSYRGASSSGNLPLSVFSYSLEKLDSYFTDQAWYSGSSYSDDQYVSLFDLGPVQFWTHIATGGLLLKRYAPDLNSSFVETSAFEDAVARSFVKLAQDGAGEAGIDIMSLIGGKKIFDFYQKAVATGGQLDEMIRAEYGVSVSDLLDIPMLLKVWNIELNFDPTTGTGGEQLGMMTSNGIAALSGVGANGDRVKSNTLYFSAKEYGEIHFYLTVEPYVDYSQGIDPMLHKTRMVDQFWPSFDRVGFQPLRADQLQAVAPSALSVDDGAYNFNLASMQVGVQPAWTEYTGKLNVVVGDLGDPNSNMSSWTWTRIYDESIISRTSSSLDVSTYINPTSFNNPFKDTSIMGRPFVYSIGYSASFKAPISRTQLDVDL